MNLIQNQDETYTVTFWATEMKSLIQIVELIERRKKAEAEKALFILSEVGSALL